ncbi:MAG: DUF2752 domain-containing protein [Sarcina sp.]
MAITKWHKIEFVLLILGVILIYVIPLSYVEGRSFCLFYNLFEIECLGCGFSRAFFNMTRLNLVKAIKYNKMILVLGPFAILMLISELKYLIYSFKKKKDDGSSLLLKIFAYIREFCVLERDV